MFGKYIVRMQVSTSGRGRGRDVHGHSMQTAALTAGSGFVEEVSEWLTLFHPLR